MGESLETIERKGKTLTRGQEKAIFAKKQQGNAKYDRYPQQQQQSIFSPKQPVQQPPKQPIQQKPQQITQPQTQPITPPKAKPQLTQSPVKKGDMIIVKKSYDFLAPSSPVKVVDAVAGSGVSYQNPDGSVGWIAHGGYNKTVKQ